MAEHIYLCPKCKSYSMENTCPKCTTKTDVPRPAKYSPDDKYADLKRKAKEEIYKEKGYI